MSSNVMTCPSLSRPILTASVSNSPLRLCDTTPLVRPALTIAPICGARSSSVVGKSCGEASFSSIACAGAFISSTFRSVSTEITPALTDSRTASMKLRRSSSSVFAESSASVCFSNWAVIRLKARFSNPISSAPVRPSTRSAKLPAPTLRAAATRSVSGSTCRSAKRSANQTARPTRARDTKNSARLKRS